MGNSSSSHVEEFFLGLLRVFLLFTRTIVYTFFFDKLVREQYPTYCINTDRSLGILQVVKEIDATALDATSMINVVSSAFALESSPYSAHEYGKNSHPCLFLRENDT